MVHDKDLQKGERAGQRRQRVDHIMVGRKFFWPKDKHDIWQISIRENLKSTHMGETKRQIDIYL